MGCGRGLKSMSIRRLAGGLLGTNCYIVACEETGEAMVIDPGLSEGECEEILSEISAHHLRLKYIVNTHGHPDHTSCNSRLKEATAAEILIHEGDGHLLVGSSRLFQLVAVSPPADRLLHDGDTVKVGRFELRVIHTPGHSSGSISLYCESEGVVFTGDTLFASGIGRTDLPGSSAEGIMRSLRDKLMKLPDQTIVYPGHGPETTIGEERRWNPFLHV